MTRTPSVVRDWTFHLTRPQPTFLGSETAPDGAQVRRRLEEMHDGSVRRKNYASCAAAGCTLIAVLLTQHVGAHPARVSQVRRRSGASAHR